MTNAIANALETARIMTQNRDAYAAGWTAAELWNSGVDDVDTRPPRSRPLAWRRAWHLGFADAEEAMFHD